MPLLTDAHMAAHLDLSTRTFRRLVAAHRVPYRLLPNGARRWDPDEVERLLCPPAPALSDADAVLAECRALAREVEERNRRRVHGSIVAPTGV